MIYYYLIIHIIVLLVFNYITNKYDVLYCIKSYVIICNGTFRWKKKLKVIFCYGAEGGRESLGPSRPVFAFSVLQKSTPSCHVRVRHQSVNYPAAYIACQKWGIGFVGQARIQVGCPVIDVAYKCPSHRSVCCWRLQLLQTYDLILSTWRAP